MATKKGEHPTYTVDFFKADSDAVRFYDDPMTDNIITALLALGTETWALRQRTLVLERVLAEKGVSREMIEGYMPTDEDVAEWEQERERFVDQLMRPLMREGNLHPMSKRETDQ